MKKLLVLGIVAVALVLFACSQSPDVTGPDNEQVTTGWVERPQFVDTRPLAEIFNSTRQATSEYFEKKPVNDPPDTVTGDPNPNPPHKYAYIVGISDYEGTANDLQYCDEDALAIRDYLQTQGFTIRMDLDAAATADNIQAGLTWLMNSCQPGDEIAFSYSGHGAKAPTYGSSLISADLYYLTHGWVMQYINGANCTKISVTLDCCVAADFHYDVTDGTMLATASTNSSSYDWPPFEHGAWTYFWLQAVEDEGMIYAEDAATYAETEMRLWGKDYRLKVTAAHTDRYVGELDI